MLKPILIALIFSLSVTTACAEKKLSDSVERAEQKSAENVSDVQKTEFKSSKASVINNLNTQIFQGRINGIPFKMNLIREGNKLSGTYLYVRVQKNLRLSGTIDKAGKFFLEETDETGKKTGEWKGEWKEEKNISGAVLRGLWKKEGDKKGDEFSFYAEQQVIEFTGKAKLVNKTFKEVNKAKRSETFNSYPQLIGVKAETAEKFNKEVKEIVDIANNIYNNFLADMSEQDIKEMPEYINLESEISHNTVLANDDIISITFARFEYTGGAHGNTYMETLNYDLKNNRKLELADIFEPNSNYVKSISDYSIADLKNRLTDLTDPEWIETGAGAKEENFSAWNLTKKGLLITFENYQVAAYAAGSQTVIIPYDNLKNILRKDTVVNTLTK